MLCKTKQLWEELSMETMTPKERIDAVIKHQAVDRTPFTVVDGGACNSYTIPTLFYFREKTQPLILLAFSARFRIFS